MKVSFKVVETGYEIGTFDMDTLPTRHDKVRLFDGHTYHVLKEREFVERYDHVEIIIMLSKS